jgi:hypothetical protein
MLGVTITYRGRRAARRPLLQLSFCGGTLEVSALLAHFGGHKGAVRWFARTVLLRLCRDVALAGLLLVQSLGGVPTHARATCKTSCQSLLTARST